jgi:hypothetical protein
MFKVKLDLSGRDSVYLSNCHRYYNGLVGLEIYRKCPIQEISLEPLKGILDGYERTYEGAVNGDRVQISMRKKARKDLTEMFEKIRHYLQSVAGEDDIPSLLQAGFDVTSGLRGRRRTVVVPAT